MKPLAAVLALATLAQSANGQINLNSPRAPKVAVWLEPMLGGSKVNDAGPAIAGTLGLNGSHRNLLLTLRAGLDWVPNADFDATAETDELLLTHGSALVGLRTSGHRAFGSASAGIATVTRVRHVRQCESCAETRPDSTRRTALAAEVAARANAILLGVGVRGWGMFASGVNTIGFSVGLGIGWFGR
jgi:hypothetical protein